MGVYIEALNLLRRDLYILKTYLIERQRRPYLASFKVSYACNLTCCQCPFYKMEAPELNWAQAVDVLDRLQARGDRLVVFEGGEPLLWRSGGKTIHDLVWEARRRFLAVGMTTNGTLPLDVPTDILWVSVDGLRETHNRLRGAYIFDRVIENIRQSNHPKLMAHITVNSQNDGEIPALVEFMAPLVRGITVQFYYPYNHQDELFLDFKRRAALLDRLIEMKKTGLPILNSVSALRALKTNQWRCVDWLVDSANPDGIITQGCYLRGRDDIDCARCGFSPHTEISLAWQGSLGAIRAGNEIFFKK
ncbi:MAG: radical SAM protein [Anaerolineaceae bacterium]